MVGLRHFISNAVLAYITVANNKKLRAGNRHAKSTRSQHPHHAEIIVQNLRFNLLSASQLMDCGVKLHTDLQAHDIMLHFVPSNKPCKYLGRARANNGVYVLDFNILHCSGDTDELSDLVPLRFKNIQRSEWKHPDSRPCVPHHKHVPEIGLLNPGPNSVRKTVTPPTTLCNNIVGKGFNEIAEAEQLALPDEGMSTLELAATNYWVFGSPRSPHPGPARDQLY
ncbi:unnamed protein product [Closterium sp. NIES-53]